MFNNLLRAAAILSVLAAGSCASGLRNDGDSITSDGATNHPIAVEPNYREIKVQYAGGGLTPDDAARFDAFLSDYRAHGNGSIGISVPSGAPSRAAITYFGERAAATGISRDKILVSTHDTMNGDFRVDVSFITYTAHTDTCGDWSENLAISFDNLTPKNFGCSVQHNVAAMVADPRDLIQPRTFDSADANRAGVVLGNYEQGKPTGAEKTSEQSAAISIISK